MPRFLLQDYVKRQLRMMYKVNSYPMVIQTERRTLSTDLEFFADVKVSVVPSPLAKQAGSRWLMLSAPMNSELISKAGKARPISRLLSADSYTSPSSTSNDTANLPMRSASTHGTFLCRDDDSSRGAKPFAPPISAVMTAVNLMFKYSSIPFTAC